MELEIIEYQQGDISFFSDFISFRNSLYKDEDSFVKEGLSEFKLFSIILVILIVTMSGELSCFNLTPK